MQGNGYLAGPMFVGVKLVGDTYVPAGEESTRVNTTDGSVRILLRGSASLCNHHGAEEEKKFTQ